MTQKEFKQISINKEKIKKIKQDYYDLYNISQVKGQQITDIPYSYNCSDKVADYVIKVSDLKDRINILENYNKNLIKKADMFIKKVPDMTIRQILEYRYIVGMDDWNIHRLIGVHKKDINRIIDIFFIEVMLYVF